MDLSSLAILATIVFSTLKVTSGLNDLSKKPTPDPGKELLSL